MISSASRSHFRISILRAILPLPACLSKQSHRCYSTDSPAEELQYSDPISSSHNDLESFLKHSKRQKLDRESTVFTGTHYEYTTQTALRRLGLSLQRIGGKSDAGIDLLGTWTLPSTPQPLKVLVQCKAMSGNPSHARELEGAFAGAPQGWRDSNVVALLVCQNLATKGVREALGRSRWPMGYVFCRSDGKILQMIWNQRAAEVGLEGVGVGMRYGEGSRKLKEIILTWKGENIED